MIHRADCISEPASPADPCISYFRAWLRVMPARSLDGGGGDVTPCAAAALLAKARSTPLADLRQDNGDKGAQVCW